MQFELAKLSLEGDRAENQDRVAVMSAESCALIVAIDGMGGHAGGSAASAEAARCFSEAFRSATHPMLDPQGFLIRTLEKAHSRIVALGESIPVDQRPRATCAVCLVQDGRAYSAHVGDSRIYHLRNGRLISRSRDHSHVELLLQDGEISEEEVRTHPMRNYVESCLGGDVQIPDLAIAMPGQVQVGDVIVVCSDGLWSGLEDEDFLPLAANGADLEQELRDLADMAVKANAPHSDNTSAAILRFSGATP